MPRTIKASPDRANEILEAARDLFNEKGFENTSVDDIVRRVGVAKGLFYYYFDSKEEIIGILYDRLFDEISASITAVMEKKGLTALERFGEVFETNRDITCRSSMIVAYFKKERNQSFHLTMERRAHGLLINVMEGIIMQGVDEGTFRGDHPRETAIALNAMYQGLKNDLPPEPTSEELMNMFQALRDLSERLLGMDAGSLDIFDKLLPPSIGGTGRPRTARRSSNVRK